MRTWRLVFIVMILILSTSCANVDSVLFVTKTSLGVDFDTKPPTASIAYDRVEGYVGPRYENGAVPPVVARIQTDGRVFNTRVRQLYATGSAATLVAKPDGPVGPAVLTGEKRLMFFGTTTTTGLKVTFTGQYPDSFHLGYKRKEFSFIPLGSTIDSAGNKVDIYPSVLATLDTTASADAGPSAGLLVGQFFTTGAAADLYAKDPVIQSIFKNAAADAFSAYRASVAAQESEATRVLRCYLGVAVSNLPEVWEHAHAQGLFRKPGQLAEMKALHDRAMADPAVRDRNLRTANQWYASDIAILEGSQPTRLAQMTEHHTKVCEIARR